MQRLQYPIKSSGDFVGLLDQTSNNTTNWVDITSADFLSSASGNQIPNDLVFSDLAIYNGSGNVAYIKLRPKTANNDPTTNELQILAGGILATNILGLADGNITTMSFKKTAGTDELVFTCSFVKRGE